ncbi:MAG: putative molybdenum carrier protein [Bacteroidales bacterium]
MDSLKLVSGGQTGIDRAVLDFCLDHGIPCGGWCPAGRKAEDGIIDEKYPLKELPEASYGKRTAANVRDSDATVILFPGEMEGGTLKSFEFVIKEKKPFLLLDMSILDATTAADRLRRFLESYAPSTVNFSGPRHSQWEEGYGYCYAILQLVLGTPIRN